MPGAYTHITIARLLTSGNALKKLELPSEARKALMEYTEFCHMGAISPDYPYLRLVGRGKKASEIWANAMHHKYGTLTENNIFHVGIDYLKHLIGNEQSKCLAWFLGYASHVIADVTCHPMTNLLVGDYEAGNQTAHRISEMHQDVYIFETRIKGDVSKSEHIKHVVGSCRDLNDKKKIDMDLEKMWKHILSKTFPIIYEKQTLNIHSWHRSVQLFLDNFGEELSIIPSRHIRGFFDDKGVAYPRFDEIDRRKYVNNLQTPNGIKTYDQVFDHAKANVAKVWKLIAEGIYRENDNYKEKIKIWNLDTGQEVIAPIVMWENIL
jgi:hypothetical protein